MPDKKTSPESSPSQPVLSLSQEDIYFIASGSHERSYDWLGAHHTVHQGVEGTRFVVWAPSARRVSVVGSFNDWDAARHPMQQHSDTGLWETFVEGVGQGEQYKYHMTGADGRDLPLKADPYAFAMQHPPETASIVWSKDNYSWQDDSWMSCRDGTNDRHKPISIYEVHLGSWKRKEQNRYLTYGELADELIAYVVDQGFTHLELMPVSEYPFDGSWGYQPLGLFAPTSRFGTPDDFKYFVDCCHQAGLAVLIDWVPGHFPSDEHGLGYFDGSHLYEHEDRRKGFHPDWNTLIYNYGRQEVITFLMSNALFWLDQFHIDGLRVDAVASMLYLDYSRQEGEWLPNKQGGRENLEAIDLLRNINTRVFKHYPSASTFAEESTAWPGVSRPVYDGGLGFGFKWNMGWMHDSLQYIGKDPIYRQYHHGDITFGLSYAFSENFVLPLSHDEVVHGKGSILGKMPGDEWQRFANLRAYYGFMWTHPGKKLLFMGGEFAQANEWNHDHSLDWHLLQESSHRGIQQLIKDLNQIYKDMPALFELDCDGSGFEWIEASDHANSVYAYLRKANNQDDHALVICNFTPTPHQHYRVGIPAKFDYEVGLNTDSSVYGGSDFNQAEKAPLKAEKQSAQGREHSIAVRLPPLSTLILKPVRD